MSIYKKQRLVWKITESYSTADKVDFLISSINHTLRGSSDEWLSRTDLFIIYKTIEVWQQDLIDAAIRTMKEQDKVRIMLHGTYSKIQYKPVKEREVS